MKGPQIEFSKGLTKALCALSFFKQRHGRIPRYKKSKRRVPVMVSHYREYARVTRRYIQEARRAGFRGSIVKAVFKAYHEEALRREVKR